MLLLLLLLFVVVVVVISGGGGGICVLFVVDMLPTLFLDFLESPTSLSYIVSAQTPISSCRSEIGSCTALDLFFLAEVPELLPKKAPNLTTTTNCHSPRAMTCRTTPQISISVWTVSTRLISSCMLLQVNRETPPTSGSRRCE